MSDPTETTETTDSAAAAAPPVIRHGADAIADALGRRGIVVDRHKVDLEEPLKSLGTYKVAVRVYAGLTPEVTVVVEPKG